MKKLVFVSHDSADQALVNVLVDLLCTALSLRVSDFLCTSLEGAKLRGGEYTDTAIRHAIRNTPAFLGILTPIAMSSTYVLFELGARWGNSKSYIPLLAKGIEIGNLKEPLKATNALRLSEESDIMQLVQDLAEILGVIPEPPNAYFRKLLVVAKVAAGGIVRSKDIPPKELPLAMGPLFESLRRQALKFFEANNLLYRPKLIAATSCNDNSESSIVSAGFARSIAETEDGNVLLVDVNKQNGANAFFYKSNIGHSLRLAMESERRKSPVVGERLFLVSQTFTSKSLDYSKRFFSDIMPRLRCSDYDYIIFDMPPVGLPSITADLARFTDLVLLVVDKKRTLSRTIDRAIRRLSNNLCKVIIVDIDTSSA